MSQLQLSQRGRARGMRSWGSPFSQGRIQSILCGHHPRCLLRCTPQKALGVRKAEPQGGVGSPARPAPLGKRWLSGRRGRCSAALGDISWLGPAGRWGDATISLVFIQVAGGLCCSHEGNKEYCPLGSQGQACLKPSSVETQNNGSSLKPESVLTFLNQ